MIRDRLERIRERAFALWEGAGRGHGQDEAHWHQASSEIDAEDASTPVKRPAKPKPAAAIAAAPAAAPPKPAAKAKTAKAPAKPAKGSPGGAGKSR